MPYRYRHLHATALAGAMVLATASMAASQSYQTEHHPVSVETIAEGLVHPWGLALLPDGRFLVTERDDGHLRLGTRDGELSEPLDGVPEVFRYVGETPRSQGGLFDVELHPQFDSNQLVYLSFAKPTERGAAVAIVRGRLVEENGTARLADVEEIFEMQEEDQDSSGLHFGGRMAFHPEDGTLFLSIGERRDISRAQDAADQAGSILRMTDDGTVPEDNPFLGDDENNDYVWSYGHRNVQAMAFHGETHDLWVADHGPEGGDEINRVEAGANYGWPYITGGVDYSGAPIGVGLEHEGMVSPVHVFEDTLAPSGLAFHSGEMFPQWQNDMLIGGLAGQALARVTLEGDAVGEVELMLEEHERRLRDVQVADDGAVWVITEHEDGEVLRLSPDEDDIVGEAN
jgi:aldose sugar dehydrogenase